MKINRPQFQTLLPDADTEAHTLQPFVLLHILTGFIDVSTLASDMFGFNVHSRFPLPVALSFKASPSCAGQLFYSLLTNSCKVRWWLVEARGTRCTRASDAISSLTMLMYDLVLSSVRRLNAGFALEIDRWRRLSHQARATDGGEMVTAKLIRYTCSRNRQLTMVPPSVGCRRGQPDLPERTQCAFGAPAFGWVINLLLPLDNCSIPRRALAC